MYSQFKTVHLCL
uniref:Uncharacterized protein n=1 Tax=Arundo donax TaxID=35708 RepID=A0A0A8YVP5_ARUDO